MPLVDYDTNTFDYFTKIKPNIIHGSILDYGSNCGRFLHFSKEQIDPTGYTGIDIDKAAIEEGSNLYPTANWIYYPGYNPMYNSKGITNFRFELPRLYDTIISYSVLSHTSIDDFFQTIDWLYQHLAPNGSMLITYLNVKNLVLKSRFIAKRFRDFGSCDQIETDTFTYLVDNKIKDNPEDDRYLLLFINPDYLINKLSLYEVELISPDNKTFQDCILIKRDARI